MGNRQLRRPALPLRRNSQTLWSQFGILLGCPTFVKVAASWLHLGIVALFWMGEVASVVVVLGLNESFGRTFAHVHRLFPLVLSWTPKFLRFRGFGQLREEKPKQTSRLK